MRKFENFIAEIIIYNVLRPFRIFVLTSIGICLMKIYEVNTVDNIVIFITGMIILWNAREFYVRNEIDFINEKLKELAKIDGTAGYFFSEGPKKKWTLQERLDYLEKMRK